MSHSRISKSRPRRAWRSSLNHKDTNWIRKTHLLRKFLKKFIHHRGSQSSVRKAHQISHHIQTSKCQIYSGARSIIENHPKCQLMAKREELKPRPRETRKSIDRTLTQEMPNLKYKMMWLMLLICSKSTTSRFTANRRINKANKSNLLLEITSSLSQLATCRT